LRQQVWSTVACTPCILCSAPNSVPAADHCLFGTFKAGLINFSVSDQNATSGFKGSLSDVTTGNTAAAIYPGLGVEGFFGPIGLRADVGDEIYFKNGTRNNLRVTFGPTIRF